MHSCSRLLVALSALISSTSVVLAALVGLEQPGVVGRCGLIFYGDYEPKEISTLSQVPDSVRAALMRHLRSRLGEAAMARLQFDSGQVVDKDRLLRVDPDAKGYQWPIPTYQLLFLFLMTNQPRVTYCAEIQLDEKGGVLREIDLPVYAKNPEKLQIIPVSQALEVAAHEGMPVDSLSVEAAYNPEFDSLEWLLSQWTRKQRTGFTITILHVVAHDANKHSWSESEADE